MSVRGGTVCEIRTVELRGEAVGAAGRRRWPARRRAVRSVRTKSGASVSAFFNRRQYDLAAAALINGVSIPRIHLHSHEGMRRGVRTRERTTWEGAPRKGPTEMAEGLWPHGQSSLQTDGGQAWCPSGRGAPLFAVRTSTTSVEDH